MTSSHLAHGSPQLFMGGANLIELEEFKTGVMSYSFLYSWTYQKAWYVAIA